jgi:multiple antibiotic resistance protein
MFVDLIEYVVVVFIGLLPIANPFSTAPLFIGLTSDRTEAARHKIATRACLNMAAILLVFLIAGSLVLSFFGITINGLRVAGGMIIGFIGFRMLFPPPASNADVVEQHHGDGPDIAFTPLAVPMLSGPGSIAVIIGMSAEVAAREIGSDRIWGYFSVGLGIILTALACWLVLRASGTVLRFFGASGIDALTRIMGFFLICIGVEFVAGGVSGFAEALISG